jgi:hypothetical protein
MNQNRASRNHASMRTVAVDTGIWMYEVMRERRGI